MRAFELLLACCVLSACNAKPGGETNRVTQGSTNEASSSPSPTLRGDGQLGSPARSLAAPDREALPELFEQVDSPALRSAQYRNGEESGISSIVESLGGGAGVFDFDRDGTPDLITTGGGILELPDKVSGLPSHLLRGLEGLEFVDVSSTSHIATASHYSHGIAIADFDNDGFSDCLVTGYGGLQLHHNLGDGTFHETALSTGLDDALWSSSAAWADFNRDGNLDLYVCHYVDWSFANHPFCPGPDPQQREICSPRDFFGLDDSFYLSDGGGHFIDSALEWGLRKGGKGLGVVAGDVDADGFTDVYIANDTTENFFYHNVGNRFEEIGEQAGVAYDDEGIPNGSMGTELADFNGDLRLDLWAANYERESFALYRNEGQGLFLHVSRSTGITALGGLFVGFGSAFLDADADGDLDVLVANGHVIKYPQFSARKQQPLLLVNNKNRFARQKFPQGHYFMGVHEGRGLATADFDNDGHMDLLFCHMNAAPALLRSKLPAAQRSLVVHLVGKKSNRDALGARVVLGCDNGNLLRTLNGGGSYLSSHQSILLFEVPLNWQPQQLRINWPSGSEQTLTLDEETPRHMTVLEPL